MASLLSPGHHDRGVWVSRCSHLAGDHIDGHRFAPTLIDFPEGRYYGGLVPTSFTAILHRTGDIRVLDRVDRGWGQLP